MNKKETNVETKTEALPFAKLAVMSSFIEWKHNPNYIVYSNGSIYSKKTNKYLKGFITSDGYLRYYLYDNKGKVNSYLAHRLIFMSFLKYEEGVFITHKDNNKLNNDISNLDFKFQYDLNKTNKREKKEQKNIKKIIEEKSKKINFELSPIVEKIIKSEETLELSFWKSLSINLINNLELNEVVSDLIDCLEVGLLSQNDIKIQSTKRSVYRLKNGFNDGLKNYS